MDFPALIAVCLIVIIAIFKTTVIKKVQKDLPQQHTLAERILNVSLRIFCEEGEVPPPWGRT